MENPAPFDLNEAIRRWREHAARLPSFRPENVEELESHLRDSVERFSASGQSKAEAWDRAKRNLGEDEALEREFAKINHPVRLWRAATSMMIGIMVATFVFQVGAAFQNSHPWWSIFSFVWLEPVFRACTLIVPAFILLIVPG